MYCVKVQSTIEDTIKKSHFIGIIAPCLSIAEINQQYQKIQQQHPNANHIAFAYHLKNNDKILIRCNDAGEPSGTAGRPILNHLEGNQLINVIILVVRYFGGIKLGAGGLSRAYGNLAKGAIANAKLIKFIDYDTLTLTLPYDQFTHFEYQLNKINGSILEQLFTEIITVKVRIPSEQLQEFKKLFS